MKKTYLAKLSAVEQRARRPGYDWMLQTRRHRRLKRRVVLELSEIRVPQIQIKVGSVVKLRNRAHNGLIGAVTSKGIRILSEGPHCGLIVQVPLRDLFPMDQPRRQVVPPPDRGRRRVVVGPRPRKQVRR